MKVNIYPLKLFVDSSVNIPQMFCGNREVNVEENAKAEKVFWWEHEDITIEINTRISMLFDLYCF